MRLSKVDYGEGIVILMLIILGAYLEFFPLTEQDNDLKSERIFLKEKPILRERGDNRQKYISIVDANESVNYDITGCALLKTKTDALLGLEEHDSLTLGIRKSRSFAERFNGETAVLYISSSKHGQLLTLEDYNECQRNSGSITPFLILWVILILIFRIFERHLREDK